MQTLLACLRSEGNSVYQAEAKSAMESLQVSPQLIPSLSGGVFLQLTPVPALPAYYCLYRAFSHRQALAGCRSLTDAFSHNDAQQLQVLKTSDACSAL